MDVPLKSFDSLLTAINLSLKHELVQTVGILGWWRSR